MADAASFSGPFGDHLMRICQSVLEQPDLKLYLRHLCRGLNEPLWKKVGKRLRFRSLGENDRAWAQTRLMDAGIIEMYRGQAVFANVVYRDFFCNVFKNSVSYP